MDPYLESHEWTSVHHGLSAQIARQIAPEVRPKYIVRPVERFVVEVLDDLAPYKGNIYPDVGIVEATATYRVKGAAARPLRLATLMPTKVPHVTIEIRHVVDGMLVTAVEIISPTNKRGTGYQQYLEKRALILASETHLLEIDLLRLGRRVPMRDPLPDAPYFVFLSREEKRPYLDVWPIQLHDPLPIVPIPLLPGDPDVPLDLQLALNTLYDEMGYDLSIAYTKQPEIPLAGETAVWAANLLQKTRGAAWEKGEIGD
jgi:hypothetical protein